MCWHKWTPWRSYVFTGEKTSMRTDLKNIVVTQTRQVRKCLKCGKEQHEIIENASGATWDNTLNGQCDATMTAPPEPKPSTGA